MNEEQFEVSVVLPCLNEENTLEACIRAALNVLEAAGIRGEVIVADNASTDRSPQIAVAAGARLVPVRAPGYGSALRAGIEAAQADRVVFYDADMSYDAEDIPKFVGALRTGAALVVGSRMRGHIDAGAMPRLHRYFGTPALTALANVLFHAGVSDINCGMRGLTKSAYQQLDLYSDGMEFASEMLVKAALNKVPITEVPIRFHADQRGHAPHLRSFRDGWRHLQLMLHYCPVWLFFVPGVVLSMGGAGVVLAMLAGFTPRAALLVYLLANLSIMVGLQILLLGLTAQDRVKRPRWRGGRVPVPEMAFRVVSLNSGVVLGAFVTGLGLLCLAYSALDIFFMAPQAGGHVISFDDQVIRLALLGNTLFMSGLLLFFTVLMLGLFGLRVSGRDR